jgi:predicted Zn-dependent protease
MLVENPLSGCTAGLVGVRHVNGSRLTFTLAAVAVALAGCTIEPFADPVPVPASYAPYAYAPAYIPPTTSLRPAQPQAATTAPSTTPAVIDDATRDQAIAIAHASILKRFGIDPDPQLNEYLILVGSLVTINTPRPDAEYTYLLLRTDQPISCALWPKTVCISRGLFAQMQDESELAGVIAREISNLIAARPIKAAGLTVPATTQPAVIATQSASSNLLANRLAGKLIDILIKEGMGPDLDQAADVEAAQFAAAAHYAPDGLLHLLTRQKPATATATAAADSTQPASASTAWQRIQALNANLQIINKAYPASDARLPARFETYQKPRPAAAANP